MPTCEGRIDANLPLAALAACVLAVLGTAPAAAALPLSALPGRAVQAAARNGAAAAPGSGRTVHVVQNCNDSGPGSLRQAVADARNDDVIDLTQLGCATITLLTGELDVGASVTIRGPGRDALAIDGNGSGRVLYHTGYSLLIEGLTIANGSAPYGYGGCVSAWGEVEVRDSLVTGCAAGSATTWGAIGGGLEVIGTLTLRNSTVSGNSVVATNLGLGGGADARYGMTVIASVVSGNTVAVQSGRACGGGLFSHRDAVVREASLITGNHVTLGTGTAYAGGFGVRYGEARVVESTISGNTVHATSAAIVYGGGVQAGEYPSHLVGSVVLESSVLAGNTASSDCSECFVQGGGANAIGPLDVRNSTIRDNHASTLPALAGRARGGGLSTLSIFGYEAPIVLTGSTVSGNTVVGGGNGGRGFGGGLYTVRDRFEVRNSTIAFNSASTAGGGISGFGGHPGGTPVESLLVSSIVAGNQAPTDHEVTTDAWSNDVQLVVTGDHNLLRMASTGATLPADTIYSDPLLEPLADNGGPTLTHALAEGSPARDQGSNPEGLAHDQRGAPWLREWGAAPDIGAFEWQPWPERIFCDGFEVNACP